MLAPQSSHTGSASPVAPGSSSSNSTAPIEWSKAYGLKALRKMTATAPGLSRLVPRQSELLNVLDNADPAVGNLVRHWVVAAQATARAAQVVRYRVRRIPERVFPFRRLRR